MGSTIEASPLLNRVREYLVQQRLQASLRSDWTAYEDYSDALYFLDSVCFEEDFLGDVDAVWVAPEIPKKVIMAHGYARYKTEKTKGE